MMNNELFQQIFEDQIQRSRDILIEKAKEYATDTDRLANFKAAAALQGVSVHQALAGMMAKHTYSIYKMCGDDQGYTEAQWDEKITDSINYLILLKAVTVEDYQELEDIWQGLPYQAPKPMNLGFPPEVLDEISANAHGRDLAYSMHPPKTSKEDLDIYKPDPKLYHVTGEEPRRYVISAEEADKMFADQAALNGIASILAKGYDLDDTVSDITAVVEQVRAIEPDEEAERTKIDGRPRVPTVFYEKAQNAQNLLNSMAGLIIQYGWVTVGDYKDLLGWAGNRDALDNKWGWNSLEKAAIVTLPSGYRVQLPELQQLP